MNHSKKIKSIIIFIILIASFYIITQRQPKRLDVEVSEKENNTEKLFEGDRLQTNTAKTRIALDEILGGGPEKDGIPALSGDRINFVEPTKVTNVPEESLGILLESENEARFYPYTILVWHEIVNDTFNGRDVAVTFCPLCGSAIVYNRNVNGVVLEFGVSGKLWQSNLLMFDRLTETLWSQIEGSAVVGDYLGTQLELLDSQLVTFAEAQLLSNNLKVLSDQTGYNREYGFYPYENYENTEDLYFPVNNLDTSLPSKTLIQASVIDGLPVAFVRQKVIDQRKVILETSKGTIYANYDGARIIISDQNDKTYPSYVTLWFSWANHNEGPVWK